MVRADLPSSRTGLIFRTLNSCLNHIFLCITSNFSTHARSILLTDSKSAKINSRLMVSISASGSTRHLHDLAPHDIFIIKHALHGQWHLLHGCCGNLLSPSFKFSQSLNICKFKSSRNCLLRSNHFRQFLEAFIWNFYHPDVWINGRKGIVAASAPTFVIALNGVDLPTFGSSTCC